MNETASTQAIMDALAHHDYITRCNILKFAGEWSIHEENKILAEKDRLAAEKARLDAEAVKKP